MCKNAGKTTAFNRIIRELSEEEGRTLALTSIGRDGELQDLVTGTEKPPIYMREGMLAATASGLLPLCDVSREILRTSGFFTSLGEVVVFRAKSDGFVQLAGPGIVEQMGNLRQMLQEMGADCVLIDGALGRLSPLAGSPEGVCVLSTGASLGRDKEKVIAQTAFVAEMLSLPEKKAQGKAEGRFTLFGDDSAVGCADTGELPGMLSGKTLLVQGALTDAQARRLVQKSPSKDGLTILLKDASCLLAKEESCRTLMRQGASFAVLKGSRLAAITVNPVSAGGWRFDRKAFLDGMQAAVQVPVRDVMTEEND